MRLFAFGLGFCARTLAELLQQKGWEVQGTSKDVSLGLLTFNRDNPLLAEDLLGTTHVLISIPPDEKGDLVYDLALPLLRQLPSLQWLGYLSTTAVYGDHKGGRVTEETMVNPSLGRSQRRAQAEKLWLESGLPVHIFRLAGIYGKGRSAVESLRQGKAHRIHKPGHVFSRIHVEDVANVLWASINRPNPGSIYNVCDDEAAPQDEVILSASKLLGIEPPPLIDFAEAELSPMAKSFYVDNKLVSNQKIKAELGVKLIYPSYKEGLLNCI